MEKLTPMKRIASTFATFALLASPALVLAASPAVADTDTSCGVTHAEFDNMALGRTPTEVAVRFDVYGTLIDDTQTYYRRAYRSCWDPGVRRVIVEYSYDENVSVDFYVRDVPA